jgi:hypothetical protein
MARLRTDPLREPGGPERGCEVTVYVDLSPPLPVVSVVGALGRAGGALLTAVLEYVREQDGRPAAVDLRDVPVADSHALVAVITSDAVLVATSPAVDRALADVTRCLPGVVSHESGDGIERPAGSRQDVARGPLATTP